MPETQDRRVRRTRTSLHQALMSLMSEKGYDAVSVQDIIDRADVGRSTFYSHFTDKADLLTDMLEQFREVVDPPVTAQPPDRRRPMRFSLEMFRHVSDQQQLLRALLGRPGAAPVVTQIEGMLTDIVRRDLDLLVLPDVPPRVPLDLVASSVVATYVASLTWWVATGFQNTPEQMDALFQTLSAPGVRSALGTSAHRTKPTEPTGSTERSTD